MIDINEYGKYRIGLTSEEIQEYLKERYNEGLKALPIPYKTIKKCLKATYKKFCAIAGVNTVGVVKKDNKNITLMYRYDVKRFADKLFL
jgi:20S proteasome alpha/beta subunit